MDTTLLYKPVVAGLTAYGIDKFYFKNGSSNHNMYFAGSVALGIGLGAMTNSLTADVQQTILPNGKGLLQRAVEIGGGAASAYGINKYVLKNESYKDVSEIGSAKIIGAIVVADVVSEYFCDYMAGRPLSLME